MLTVYLSTWCLFMAESTARERIYMSRKVFKEIMETKERLDTLMESVELMNDREFMKSYRRAKKDVSRGHFEDWEGLKSDA